MCRTYQDYRYDSRPEPEDFLPLSLQDKILLKCGLPIGIGKFQLEGWKDKIPWYLFECDKHGLFTNYRQGHSQKLYCPKCQDEFHEKLQKYFKERSNWRGGASRSSEEVSIDGNTMRGSFHALSDPSEDKEVPP